MTILDPAAEVIRMRRALSEVVSSGARLGESPADGIRLTLPTDDQFWLTLRIVDGSISGDQDVSGQQEEPEPSWELTEVMSRGKYLPNEVTVLSSGSQEQILVNVDKHYRRLLLERRNAACGTPTKARSGP